jgi:hypothetical protein
LAGSKSLKALPGRQTGTCTSQTKQNDGVQEPTASVQFVLMLGKHVNATTGGNMCATVSIDEREQDVNGIARWTVWVRVDWCGGSRER